MSRLWWVALVCLAASVWTVQACGQSAPVQKEEKPGTGLDAHPESMLDIEFLLPFVGLASWDTGVDTVDALLRYGT